MRRYVMAVMSCLLMAACSQGGASQTSAPPGVSAISEAPQALTLQGSEDSGERASKVCQPPGMFFKIGKRQVRIEPGWDTRTRFSVRLGDTFRLRATGNCGYTVSAHPQRKRVLRVTSNRLREDVGWPSHFEAVQSGVVRLVVTMPMCAQPRSAKPTGCRGGIDTIGTAVVTVRP